ncbi:MAG TPA: hypothetical protein VFZ65_13975 [Planctomycetota bacterium]|nr:hypothetical protein [Planctomycetota bacterium]
MFMTYPWTEIPMPNSEREAYTRYEHELVVAGERDGIDLRDSLAVVEKYEREHPELGFYMSFTMAVWAGIRTYFHGISLGMQGASGESCAVFRMSLESFMHAFLIQREPELGWRYRSNDSNEWYRLARKRTESWFKANKVREELGLFESTYVNNWLKIRGAGHASWRTTSGCAVAGPGKSSAFKMGFSLLDRRPIETGTRSVCLLACVLLSQANLLLDHHPGMAPHRNRWGLELDKTMDLLLSTAGVDRCDVRTIDT